MKIGVQTGFSGSTSPDLIADFGRIAEQSGFHSLWVPEHVVFFREYASRYPYSADGRIPGNPDGVMEPLTALTFVAACTERIRLGTGICLVPQRQPIYTAKQVADLDYLSKGRLDFGIGVGWLREEFAALDVPWERRGARTRECIAVMKTLWCDEVSSFQGEFYDLRECLQNPKPAQKPHPPLIFGGESDAALRRVAELGQGWFGYNLTPGELETHLKRLDELLADVGRTRSDLTIHVAPNGHPDADTREQFEQLGVGQLIVPLFARDSDKLRQRAEGLASEMLK
ncbi:MAG: LLM class F420-dependent oxidoreductase [Myxococcota bacterium]